MSTGNHFFFFFAVSLLFDVVCCAQHLVSVSRFLFFFYISCRLETKIPKIIANLQMNVDLLTTRGLFLVKLLPVMHNHFIIFFLFRHPIGRCVLILLLLRSDVATLWSGVQQATRLTTWTRGCVCCTCIFIIHFF